MRTVLFLSGELDFASVEGWKAEIAAALIDRPSSLVLDLSEVSFIDSLGLGLLVAARTRCQDRSTTLELRHVSEAVCYLLRVTGLDAVFETELVDGQSPERHR